MGRSVTAFEPTPNPNAVKCLLDGPAGERVRSYFKPEQARGDALGEALFAIPGVTNVLIHTSFITVCKEPGASWGAIKSAVRRVVREQE